MERDDFFKALRESLVDSRTRFYRNLVFIEKKDYLDELRAVLSIYKDVVGGSRTAYAFHPWATGSKERLSNLRDLLGKFDDIDYSSSEYYLGKTYDLVVLDLVDNFQPNYIGRLVDLTSGGGLIVMYTDNLTENKIFRNSIARNGVVYNFYEERFRRKLKEHQGIFSIDTEYHVNRFVGEVKPTTEKKPLKSMFFPKELHDLCLTDEQDRVLEEFRILQRGGKRMLVITAPRGRGKSAVTGLGIAALIADSTRERVRVVITAPSLASASQIMEFAKRGLDVLKVPNEVEMSDLGIIRAVRGDHFSVVFVSPETAIGEDGDFLVVDEAAAIGINFLAQYANRWRKVVFVSTVYGYEGSGKAFLRYLRSVLEEKKAWTRWLTMSKPLRYAEGDPVEMWLYDALLLNPEPIRTGSLDSVEFLTLDKEKLFTDDNQLAQVYGILVIAHYRNNPDDLMIMGDGPHHILKGIRTEGGFISVTQISEEGNLPDSMIDLALKGGTFDGDLIPDRLLKHARIREIGKLKGWRIVRIATLPELQDKGFGSQLLRMVIEDAETQGIDWVGSSFMGDRRCSSFG